MDFNDVIQSRYSVRSFCDKAVETQKIDNILNAFKSAPTAMNMQPVRVYAVTDSETVEKLHAATPCFYGAVTAFVVCADEDVACKLTGSDKSLGQMDASIAATHIMLAATNEGLGSCWVCRFDSDKTKEILSISKNTVPYCYIIVGYHADDAAPAERHYLRRDLTESVIKI